MYALFVFGPVLESFLGRIRFIALYLIGALGGSLGVLTSVEVWALTDGSLQNAPAGALGASGAVFALMGAVFAMRKAMGVDVRQLLDRARHQPRHPVLRRRDRLAGSRRRVRDRLPARPDLRAHPAAGGADRSRSSAIAASRPGCSLLFVAYLVSAPPIYF